ncbi:hypothetical protein [Auraticoccus monumenti]|uniref:Transcriptional regulator, AbiEi antitoxin, Type IV TA system n=1 Tax=Auraticoccus monumenti TaxID=675864 RepID=A0A1G7AG19_9ACTN|nr:hypothetical protein [Auraticoccus monumenti]SDE13722.1 Transcriptional regulator, AbiEi antitoxin, Type IV TA system [Auraticoccus monumenti]
MTKDFAPHSELIRRFPRRDLDRAVAAGRLVRVARGWYSVPGADPAVTTALRVGGRLGCLSAARFHGLWVPPDPDVHVLGRREGPDVTSPRGVVVHPVRAWSGGDPVVGVPAAIQQVARHHDPETALVVLESALNQGLLQRADIDALTVGRNARTRALLAEAMASAQSGTETRVRRFFESRRVPVRPQVLVPGVGYVDLLVGRSLIVECDSVAHHTAAADYANDRRRDLVAVGRGYRVVRLTHAQVWAVWEQTQDALSGLVRAREHLRRLRG